MRARGGEGLGDAVVVSEKVQVPVATCVTVWAYAVGVGAADRVPDSESEGLGSRVRVRDGGRERVTCTRVGVGSQDLVKLRVSVLFSVGFGVGVTLRRSERESVGGRVGVPRGWRVSVECEAEGGGGGRENLQRIRRANVSDSERSRGPHVRVCVRQSGLWDFQGRRDPYLPPRNFPQRNHPHTTPPPLPSRVTRRAIRDMRHEHDATVGPIAFGATESSGICCSRHLRRNAAPLAPSLPCP